MGVATEDLDGEVTGEPESISMQDLGNPNDVVIDDENNYMEKPDIDSLADETNDDFQENGTEFTFNSDAESEENTDEEEEENAGHQNSDREDYDEEDEDDVIEDGEDDGEFDVIDDSDGHDDDDDEDVAVAGNIVDDDDDDDYDSEQDA